VRQTQQSDGSACVSRPVAEGGDASALVVRQKLQVENAAAASGEACQHVSGSALPLEGV